jgi:hypothetical protein
MIRNKIYTQYILSFSLLFNALVWLYDGDFEGELFGHEIVDHVHQHVDELDEESHDHHCQLSIVKSSIHWVNKFLNTSDKTKSSSHSS